MENNECQCGIWINKSDRERFELWQRILEQENPFVYIKSLVPERSKNGDFYTGDPERLTKRQWTNLVNVMHERFGVPRFDINSDLKKGIFPILSDNTSIFIGRCHIGLIM